MRNQKEVIPQIEQMESGKGKYSQYFRHDQTFWERKRHARLAQDRNERNRNLKDGEPKWKVYKLELVQHAASNAGN